MVPLNGGIHCPKGRRAKRLGMLAAALPAIKRGRVCPNPKKASSVIPIRGLPLWAIHPSNTANTGVVQGDDARPNAKPAATGANGLGTFFCQVSGSGPFGNGSLTIPRRFSPISTAKRATNFGIIKGIWP